MSRTQKIRSMRTISGLIIFFIFRPIENRTIRNADVSSENDIRLTSVLLEIFSYEHDTLCR